MISRNWKEKEWFRVPTELGWLCLVFPGCAPVRFAPFRLLVRGIAHDEKYILGKSSEFHSKLQQHCISKNPRKFSEVIVRMRTSSQKTEHTEISARALWASVFLVSRFPIIELCEGSVSFSRSPCITSVLCRHGILCRHEVFVSTQPIPCRRIDETKFLGKRNTSQKVRNEQNITCLYIHFDGLVSLVTGEVKWFPGSKPRVLPPRAI